MCNYTIWGISKSEFQATLFFNHVLVSSNNYLYVKVLALLFLFNKMLSNNLSQAVFYLFLGKCVIMSSNKSQTGKVRSLPLYRTEHLQNHQRSFPCGIRDNVRFSGLGNIIYDRVPRHTEEMSGRNRESKFDCQH